MEGERSTPKKKRNVAHERDVNTVVNDCDNMDLKAKKTSPNDGEVDLVISDPENKIGLNGELSAEIQRTTNKADILNDLTKGPDLIITPERKKERIEQKVAKLLPMVTTDKAPVVTSKKGMRRLLTHPEELKKKFPHKFRNPPRPAGCPPMRHDRVIKRKRRSRRTRA